MLLLLNTRLVNNINCICIEQNSNIQLWVSTFQGCMTLVTVEHLIQTVDTSNFVLQIVFHLQLHLVPETRLASPILLLLNSRLVNNINCSCIEQNSNIQLWVSTFQGWIKCSTVTNVMQTVDTSNFVLQIVSHLQFHLVGKNGTKIGGLSF